MNKLIMNRLKTIKDIRKYVYANNKKNTQIMKKLIDNPENYLDIYNEWKKIKIKSERWHHFVKLASYFDEIQIIMNRVYNTLYHKDGLFNINNYFEINFIENTHIIHERCLEIDKLKLLYEEYNIILSSIINHINYKQNLTIDSNIIINGKINWNLTIQHAVTEFPLKFYIDDAKKEINTPENILLVLTNIWLKNEFLKIIKNKLTIQSDMMDILYLQKIIHILTQNESKYPINLLFDTVNKNYMKYDDVIVNDLMQRTYDNINNDDELHKQYIKLLVWIKKFQKFNFSQLSEDNIITKYLLTTVMNVDKIYEIWIFAEIINYLEKNNDIDIFFNKKNYVEFKLKGKNFQIYYEKNFENTAGLMVTHCPDFSIFHNNRVVGIFDAKNNLIAGDENASNKILAYMLNLKCSYGVAFLPNSKEKIISDDKKQFSKFKLSLCILPMNPYESEINYYDIDESLKLLFQKLIENMKINNCF